MPVRKNEVPVKIEFADNLPNGGYLPEKKVNKRKNIKKDKSKKSS